MNTIDTTISTPVVANTEAQTEDTPLLTNPHIRFGATYHDYYLLLQVFLTVCLYINDPTSVAARLVALSAVMVWLPMEGRNMRKNILLMKDDLDRTGTLYLGHKEKAWYANVPMAFVSYSVLHWAIWQIPSAARASTPSPIHSVFLLVLPLHISFYPFLLYILGLVAWCLEAVFLPYQFGFDWYEDRRFELGLLQPTAREAARTLYTARRKELERRDNALRPARTEASDKLERHTYNASIYHLFEHPHETTKAAHIALRKAHARLCEENSILFKDYPGWKGVLCRDCVTMDTPLDIERPCKYVRIYEYQPEHGPYGPYFDTPGYYKLKNPWIIPAPLTSLEASIVSVPADTEVSVSPAAEPILGALPPSSPAEPNTPTTALAVDVDAVEILRTAECVTPPRAKVLSRTSSYRQLPRLRTVSETPASSGTPSLSEDSSSSPSDSTSSSRSSRSPIRHSVRFMDFDVFTVAGPPEISRAMLPHGRRYK